MDILKQFNGKINGTLENFDRIIIHGYIRSVHSFRLFLNKELPDAASLQLKPDAIDSPDIFL